jgi:hypothetical protein
LAAADVSACVSASPWPGNARNVGQDEAPPALAVRASAHELEAFNNVAGGALELTAVDPFGHAEVTLDLFGRTIEEET